MVVSNLHGWRLGDDDLRCNSVHLASSLRLSLDPSGAKKVDDSLLPSAPLWGANRVDDSLQSVTKYKYTILYVV